MTLNWGWGGEEFSVFASQTLKAPIVERRPPLRLPRYSLIHGKQASILVCLGQPCVVV